MKDNTCIEVSHLTKDYGEGRGLFDVSFKVPEGSVFGYCGTNGSGKTTTIRHIMGFIKPQKGTVTVRGMDAWKDAEQIKRLIGYVPGEIAFPNVATGTDFLKNEAQMIGLKDMSRAEAIMKALQLDPTAALKRMSKGMKQKTALVSAFMNDPEILILDEPTTGLDPLMRQAFVSILLDSKSRGRTIFFSSHMFEELEETADYVGLLKDGHLLEVVDIKRLKSNVDRYYTLCFKDKNSYQKFFTENQPIVFNNDNDRTIVVKVTVDMIPELLKNVESLPLAYFAPRTYTLQSRFQDLIINKKENK